MSYNLLLTADLLIPPLSGNGWVGWRRESFPHNFVELVFEFENLRNFSTLHVYTNNFFSKGVQVRSWLHCSAPSSPRTKRSFSPSLTLHHTSAFVKFARWKVNSKPRSRITFHRNQPSYFCARLLYALPYALRLEHSLKRHRLLDWGSTFFCIHDFFSRKGHIVL